VYVQARQARLRNLFAHVEPATLAGHRVLELGCGTGELGAAFEQHGACVVSVDARPDFVRALRARYPGRQALVADLETWDPAPLGPFDAVLCFGLLYHLATPARLLAACARCAPTLYLETVVLDTDAAECLAVDEAGDDQAFSNHGCRPSARWIAEELGRHGFVLTDISGPAANWGGAAPSVFDWRPGDSGSWMRAGALLRRMFIGRRVQT
jgi:SAM-dependent methyltransferase